MKYKCVICQEKKIGFGNNAEPLKKGLCCDFCNTKVIIFRIKTLEKVKAEKLKKSRQNKTNK